MSLSVDATQATGVFSGAGPGTVSFSTSGTNRIVIACIHNEALSATGTYRTSSIAGGSLTWTLRSRNQWHLTSPDPYQNLDVYWAYAASQLSSVTLTVSLSGSTDDCSYGVFAVSGCASFSNPFDTNGSLPAKFVGNGSNAPETTVSTSQANSLMFNAWGSANNQVSTNVSGFSNNYSVTNGGGTNFSFSKGNYQIFSATQSSIQSGWTDININGGMTTDALTADVAAQKHAIFNMPMGGI